MKRGGKIVEKLHGVFDWIEVELSVYNAILYCKGWINHRKWLKSNKVVFNKFPEEEEFQNFLAEFKLDKRAYNVFMTRNIRVVAELLAAREIKAI